METKEVPIKLFYSIFVTTPQKIIMIFTLKTFLLYLIDSDIASWNVKKEMRSMFNCV